MERLSQVQDDSFSQKYQGICFFLDLIFFFFMDIIRSKTTVNQTHTEIHEKQQQKNIETPLRTEEKC